MKLFSLNIFHCAVNVGIIVCFKKYDGFSGKRSLFFTCLVFLYFTLPSVPFEICLLIFTVTEDGCILKTS